MRASYLEVTAPSALQGIRFLFIERPTGRSEQYVKASFSRGGILVADEIRTQPFLESAFYISDLVEPDIDAFTYTFVGEETVLDRRCKLVEGVAVKPEAEVYSKTVAAIDPADALVLKRTFFDHKGRLLKRWTVDKIERIDGYWTVRDQRMINVQENVRSRLEITDMTYNVTLDDAMFKPEYLTRS